MADEDAPQGAEEPQAPENQEIDWKKESRKWEDRAKANLAAATANEAAAKRLAEIEEAQKSEAQKVQERLEAAERRAAESEAKALRAEIAASKGVPVALLAGTTQEELEAAADALIAFRGEAVKPPVIPSQGKTPERTSPGSPAQVFGDFLTNQLN